MITRQEAKQIVDFVIRELNRRQFAYITDGRLDLGQPTGGFFGSGQLAKTRLSQYPRFVPHFDEPFDIFDRYAAVNHTIDGVIWRPKDYVDGGSFEDTYDNVTPSSIDTLDGGTFLKTVEAIDGGTF